MTAPTLILTNGKIWRGLAEGFCEALAIDGDKVLAAGSASEIAPMAGPETEVIDLGGKLATPGLNDAHLHLHFLGFGLAELDLRPHAGVTSVEKMMGIVAEAVKTAPKGAWITGRGYDHDKLDEQRHPRIEELDAVAPDNPVLLTRACGHTAVANTAALTAAGVGDHTPDPYGGRFGRDGSGKLNGALFENARAVLNEAMPVPDLEDHVAAIERAGRHLLSYGVTSCMEAAIGGHHGMIELRAYPEALKQGRLPVRVAGTLMGDLSRNVMTTAFEEGLVTGVGDDMFRVGPVKFFVDGSIGAGTALMSKAYPDDPANFGLACLTQEQVIELAWDAHSKGYQIAPHAIGDEAIEMVLNAYEYCQAQMPRPDARHRIEHCGWLREGQIERMKSLGVIPAGQPSFLYFFGDGYYVSMGDDRPDYCYPFGAWLKEGLHPSASTDSPVTDVDVFPCIYALVTRKTGRTGRVLGDGEQVSVAEALHMYTYNSAYGVHDEDRKGRLIPGQLADVAVFDTDFFTCDPEAILTAACEMTILGGKVAFARAKEAEVV